MEEGSTTQDLAAFFQEFTYTNGELVPTKNIDDPTPTKRRRLDTKWYCSACGNILSTNSSGHLPHCKPKHHGYFLPANVCNVRIDTGILTTLMALENIFMQNKNAKYRFADSISLRFVHLFLWKFIELKAMMNPKHFNLNLYRGLPIIIEFGDLEEHCSRFNAGFFSFIYNKIEYEIPINSFSDISIEYLKSVVDTYISNQHALHTNDTLFGVGETPSFDIQSLQEDCYKATNSFPLYDFLTYFINVWLNVLRDGYAKRGSRVILYISDYFRDYL
jgi:hypothetical protein